MPATLIVITGLPASGKTTLGRWLAAQLQWPCFYKDGIKEVLFETVGWSDAAFSKRLGAASNEILFHVAEAMLAAHQSLILESNFAPAFTEPRLTALQSQYDVRLMQILCRAEPAVLMHRYQARQRHTGHLDALRVPDMEQAAQTPQVPLNIQGPLIEVDTTAVDQIDYPAILAKVRSEI